MSTLDARIDDHTRALLERYGFDASTFEALRVRLSSGHANESDNRVVGTLEVPAPGDVVALPPDGSQARRELVAIGASAIAAGQVAVVILAGGMATRFGGVVKAGVEVSDGHSFLDLKLRDLEQVAKRSKIALHALIMTSFATDAPIREMIAHRHLGVLHVETFPQFISLRLSDAGELFCDREGRPSLYAPGHGDLVFALRRADLLTRLDDYGAKHLFVSNVDNLAATLDPAVIGAHIVQQNAMTFEVAPLARGDKGGVPARLEGRLQVIEALRYPVDFEESSIPWFSTNSFVLEIAQLDRALPLDWFRVTKHVDGQPAIQFERFVNQLTAFLPSRALAIEREGADCRFLPIKDPTELRTRLPQIRAVLQARGVL